MLTSTLSEWFLQKSSKTPQIDLALTKSTKIKTKRVVSCIHLEINKN
jgi:hypothetical protein